MTWPGRYSPCKFEGVLLRCGTLANRNSVVNEVTNAESPGGTVDIDVRNQGAVKIIKLRGRLALGESVDRLRATGRTIARLQKELAELRAQPPSPALTRRIAALVARVESLQRDEAARDERDQQTLRVDHREHDRAGEQAVEDDHAPARLRAGTGADPA